eukprot:SAG31_NODE_3870_length_3798_cov_2.788862_2_plen_159_part_00
MPTSRKIWWKPIAWCGANWWSLCFVYSRSNVGYMLQRRYGDILTVRSPFKEGSWLLIPDESSQLLTKVTRYLGYFSDTDDNSERWEVIDGDGHFHRIDRQSLYQGMGYSVSRIIALHIAQMFDVPSRCVCKRSKTNDTDPHMHERVVRKWENGVHNQR